MPGSRRSSTARPSLAIGAARSATVASSARYPHPPPRAASESVGKWGDRASRCHHGTVTTTHGVDHVDRVASTDGVSLALHDLGGDGPALLLCHPTGFHAMTWAPVAAALAGVAHCWALDFRGHGDSTRPVSGSYTAAARNLPFKSSPSLSSSAYSPSSPSSSFHGASLIHGGGGGSLCSSLSAQERVRYRVVVTHKEGVPPFGPALPFPPVYEAKLPHFRDLLLRKRAYHPLPRIVPFLMQFVAVVATKQSSLFC